MSYFVFHAISGERGLVTLVQLEQSLKKAQITHQHLQRQNQSLAYRVSLLRTESLDLDLLEEQARKNLGYAYKDEEIYYIK